jgi:nucleotide-binding universal stress UspA family protein
MKALDALTRIELKNILFATDFSTAAAGALPYAAEMARHFGAKLYAVHVRPPDAYAIVPRPGWTALAEGPETKTRGQMQALLDAFPGIDREVVIEAGEVWPTMASLIEKNNIDLVVIGTHGRTGLGKVLLGSAAEQIFRQAPCAVLTVGPRSSSEPPREGKLSEILYATDFSPEALAAAPYAISLAQEHQAHLTLLHVVEEPKAGDFVHPEQVVTSSLRLLSNLVPAEAELWCEPRCLVEQGRPAEKILEVAASNKADLIVLGVRRPRGIPGAATHLPIATAHKVVSHATCPVLTVRG